jgi:hypothetical protein
MNKIKEIKSIFVYYRYHSGKTNLPFLDWIYNKCSLMNIGIIDKVWFDFWHYDIAWNLYYDNEMDNLFL